MKLPGDNLVSNKVNGVESKPVRVASAAAVHKRLEQSAGKAGSSAASGSDVHLTGAAARAEHYEIAAYTGLVEKARALGERDSVKLLQENLRQEKDALKTVESISKRMLKETNGGSSTSTRRSPRRSTSRSRR